MGELLSIQYCFSRPSGRSPSRNKSRTCQRQNQANSQPAGLGNDKPLQDLAGQAGEHHQIDMAPTGMAPFPKFRRQGPLLGSQGLGLQVLEALVHQVEGGVNQLGRLLGGHG